jgi:hypothetical protein
MSRNNDEEDLVRTARAAMDEFEERALDPKQWLGENTIPDITKVSGFSIIRED